MLAVYHSAQRDMNYQPHTAAAPATSTQTTHSYRATTKGEYRLFRRIERSIRAVLRGRGVRQLTPERQLELFGDLPRDGEG